MSKVVETVADIVEGVWDATVGALFDGLTPDVDQPEQDTATLAKGLQKGIDKPRRITFGRDRVGGVIAHQATVTRSEKEFIQLIVLINGAPIDALEDIFIANKRLSTYPSTSYDYSLSNGHHTKANAKAVSKMQGWTNKHIGFKQAHVFIEFENNRDVFPDGISDCEFLIRGARVWDPRDSTQKSDDESTWQWSQNAVLCTLHYVRFYGANQVPLQNLPLTWWKAAASVCDEQVPFTESNVEKHEARYTINGTFSFTSKPLEVLQQLERSFAGKVFRQMGQWYVRVGAWYGSPSYTVTSDDIRGDVKIKWHADLKARANIVRAQFVDPNQEYERTDAPPVIAEGYLQKDAQPLEQTLSLPFVRSSATAQRLAAIKLEQTRLGSIELPLKHVGLRAAVGRTIKVHIPEYHINNKTYRVVSRKFKLDGAVTIQCIEDSAALWADNLVPGVNDLTPNTDYVTGQLKPVEELALSIQKDAYIKVTWSHDAPDAVDHYLLDVYQHCNGQNNQLHRLKYSYLSAILPTLQVGSYIVEVRAVNVRGKASAVNSIDFVVDTPAKPSVVADISHNTVTLSAVINDNTLGTQIQWQWLGTDEDPSTGPLIKSPIYTKTALNPDTLYNYQVRAVNTLGESPWSNKVIKTQKAPKRQEFAALNFELSQSSMWIGLGDGWLPATLSNIVRVSLKDKQTHAELAYQVIEVSLNDDTGHITAVLTDDKLNKTEDELTIELDGQGSPALTITAIHNSDVVHQTFSAAGVNPQDIKDIKQDMSELDAIAESVLEQALDSEQVFDADLKSTLHLEQKTDNTNAVISEAAAAQANENEAIATRIKNVKSAVENSSAQIVEVSQTLASNKQALSTQITQLTSTVGENHSEIKTYFITKVDSQSAISQAKTELESKVDQNRAYLDQTFYTAVNTERAISVKASSLRSEFNGNHAYITQNYYTKTAADLAVTAKVNRLESKFDNNLADLSEVYFSKADSDGALSNFVRNVSVTTGNGTASVFNHMTAQANKLGQLEARAEVGVDVNGRVTGMTITPGKMRIKAGTFELLDNSNNSAVYFDSGTGRYTFNGHINALSGTFSGALEVGLSSQVVTNNSGGLDFNNRGVRKARIDAWNGIGTFNRLQAHTLSTRDNFGGKRCVVSGAGNRRGDLGLSVVNSYIGAKISSYSTAVDASGVGWAFYARTGEIGPHTSAHETLLPKDLTPIEGDILCDDELMHIADISNAICTARLSSTPMDVTARGIYTRRRTLTDEKPAGLEGFEEWEQLVYLYDIASINAGGEGAMNVCGEGGNLQTGDLICSSSMLGKGMRQPTQSEERYTIAQVRHNVTFDSPDQVKMVAVIYKRG